jgi:hypothetical protein
VVFGLRLRCWFASFVGDSEADLNVAILSSRSVIDCIVLLHKDVAKIPVLFLNVRLLEKCKIT